MKYTGKQEFSSSFLSSEEYGRRKNSEIKNVNFKGFLICWNGEETIFLGPVDMICSQNLLR